MSMLTNRIGPLLALTLSLGLLGCGEELDISLNEDISVTTISLAVQEEPHEKTMPHEGMLSINANVTTEEYDAILAQLREQDITPMVGLPGNILLLNGKIDQFDASQLTHPVVVHKRNSLGHWRPSPDPSASWHLLLDSVDSSDMPLTQEDVGLILNHIEQSRDRGKSINTLGRFLDRSFDPPSDEVEESPALHHELDHISDGLERQRDALSLAMAMEPDAQDDSAYYLDWLDRQIETYGAPEYAKSAAHKRAFNRITVAMFFPESTGVGNEDWTQTEIDNEYDEILTGLTSVVSVAPYHANLFYFVRAYDGSDNEVSSEPSESILDHDWILELLENVGVRRPHIRSLQDRRDAANLLLEQVLSTAHASEHATIAYVVRDEEEPRASSYYPGAWPHAQFDGYMVLNSSILSGFNGGATVAAHEIMHTMHAVDQYLVSSISDPCKNKSPTGQARTEAAGAPAHLTVNTHQNCPNLGLYRDSLMDSDRLTTTGGTQLRPRLDWSTRAAIGWGNTIQVLARSKQNRQAHHPGPVSSVAHVDGRSVFAPHGNAGNFRYMPSEASFSLWTYRCLIALNDPEYVWLAQGASLTPLDHCQDMVGSWATGPVGTYQEHLQLSSIPSMEGAIFDVVQEYDLLPPGSQNCSPQASWLDGFHGTPTSTPVGCHVRNVPESRDAFVWQNRYYLTHTETCPRGTFDGVNCLLQYPWPQGGFYVSANGQDAYWIDQTSSTSCSHGVYVGSVLSMALCHLMTATPKTSFFVWSGNLYETPTMGCTMGYDDSINCELGTPPTGTTAKLDMNKFYYTP